MMNTANLTPSFSEVLPYYEPPNPALWQGRLAPAGDYHYQVVQFQDLSQQFLPEFTPTATTTAAIAIIGFAVDLGIQRNEGRVGASSGPNAWREQFARLSAIPNLAVYDVGNIVATDDHLDSMQKALAQIITQLLAAHYHPIVIGGGHEVAFGTYQGIAEFLKGKGTSNLGILNFDAHLDMRPVLPDGMGTSGSSFRQIAEIREQEQLNFDYYAIGLQSSVNPPSVVQYAHAHKVKMVYADTLNDQNALQTVVEEIDNYCENFSALYASFCLDVLAEPWAPGVSAPQPFGLTPEKILPFIKAVADCPHSLVFEVAELSPPYDQNHRTEKIAAQLVHYYLNCRQRISDEF